MGQDYQKPTLNIGTELIQRDSTEIRDIGTFAKGGSIHGMRKNKLQWKFPSSGKSGGVGGTQQQGGPKNAGSGGRGKHTGPTKKNHGLKPIKISRKRTIGMMKSPEKR